MNAVEINQLCFQYKKSVAPVLKHVTLQIIEGQITGITGKSGSGKSTLCKCMCGIIPKVIEGIYTGDLILFGQNIRTLTLAQIVSEVGIVFQNPATQLFSPTIEDELAFGPENLCVPPKEIGSRITEVLKTLQMEAYRYENPNHLSGGQQQLIALGAVLMLNPKVLICDETMSWVDEDNKKRIRTLLLHLKSQGKTIVLVDHDEENLAIADQIIRL